MSPKTRRWAALAGYRWLQLLPYPMRSGTQERSPDGKYVARLICRRDKGFLGGERNDLVLEVRRADGSVVAQRAARAVPSGLVQALLGLDMIAWAPDSSHVDFRVPGLPKVSLAKDAGSE